MERSSGALPDRWLGLARAACARAFDLHQALHVATHDALRASRQWESRDLVFQ